MHCSSSRRPITRNRTCHCRSHRHPYNRRVTSVVSDQPAELQRPASSLRADFVPILLSVLIFSAASIWCAIKSDGFLEADSLTHYLYARFAILETHYLV